MIKGSLTDRCQICVGDASAVEKVAIDQVPTGRRLRGCANLAGLNGDVEDRIYASSLKMGVSIIAGEKGVGWTT